MSHITRWLCVQLHPLDGHTSDSSDRPYPSVQSSRRRQTTFQVQELGRAKNPNKNPLEKKAVQEMEQEFLRKDPLFDVKCGQIREIGLSATNSLTSNCPSTMTT